MKEAKKTYLLIILKNIALVSLVFYFHHTLPDMNLFGVSMKLIDHIAIGLMTFFALCKSDISQVRKEIDKEILEVCTSIQKILRDAEIRVVSDKIRQSLKESVEQTKKKFRGSDIH